jgi:hypothetical protein
MLVLLAWAGKRFAWLTTRQNVQIRQMRVLSRASYFGTAHEPRLTFGVSTGFGPNDIQWEEVSEVRMLIS